MVKLLTFSPFPPGGPTGPGLPMGPCKENSTAHVRTDKHKKFAWHQNTWRTGFLPGRLHDQLHLEGQVLLQAPRGNKVDINQIGPLVSLPLLSVMWNSDVGINREGLNEGVMYWSNSHQAIFLKGFLETQQSDTIKYNTVCATAP